MEFKNYHSWKKIYSKAENKAAYGDPLMIEIKKLFDERFESKTIGSFELSERMIELDKIFPGIGLRTEGIKIYNSYARKNGLFEYQE